MDETEHMSIITRAAVLTELGKPLKVVDLVIPPLMPGQVLVKIAYSGVCHTQLSECRGLRGADPYLPHCLGHEGSGHVIEIGVGVTKVKPGDAVILSWIKGSGADVSGTKYQWNNTSINAGGVTTFSTFSIVSENRLTPFNSAISLQDAALIGCALPTGMGAVINTASVRPGQSVIIFGCGGIGLCAVAAASLSGCYPVVAVDINKSKLDAAEKMGATKTILSLNVNIDEEIRNLFPLGVDYAIEATGRSEIMVSALASVKNQGGIAVVIGNAPHGHTITIDPHMLNQGKQLRGTWGGDNVPDRDFPRYCQLIAAGKINTAILINRIYSLSEINEALEDLSAGKTIRPLIDMSLV